MFVVMRPDATEDERLEVRRLLELGGARVSESEVDGAMAFTASGGELRPDARALVELEGIAEILSPSRAPRWSGKRPSESVRPVEVAGTVVGGPELTLIAGPCAVESPEQMEAAARAARAAGVHLLRGGAYKPRTSPYDFQGLGEGGLDILREVRDRVGLPVVTEALDTESLAAVAEVADMIQVGARNMQNFSLLKRLGRQSRPVLLKRGMTATVEEWLGAAEYVLDGGNQRVVLCERGIRTFARHSRFTLDLGVIAELRRRTHLPVIVDPSHAAGEGTKVASLARAAIAAGADGVMVEVHPEPESARSDGAQALRPAELEALIAELRAIAPAVGRRLTPRRAVAGRGA